MLIIIEKREIRENKSYQLTFIKTVVKEMGIWTSTVKLFATCRNHVSITEF